MTGWSGAIRRWTGAALLAASMAAVASPGSRLPPQPPSGLDHAQWPFGMVTPGPDIAPRQRGEPARVLGFSNLRIGPDRSEGFGELLLMPAAGTRWRSTTADYSARIEPGSEWSRPGYWRARLAGLGVRVELTAAQRVAWQRYTFDDGQRAQIVVDLQHGPGASPRVERSEVAVDTDRGEISGTWWAGGVSPRQTSFVLRLDRPIERVQALPQREGENAPRLLTEVHLGPARMVVVRIAFSTIDVAAARRNLDDEPRRAFFEQRALAERQWAELLGRVEIDADDNTRSAFYAALYRSLRGPADIADADGRVRGARGAVFSPRGGRHYSGLALDQHLRAAHALFTLLVPERVDGIVRSLLDHQRQQGYLPLAPAWGRETWRALGNPALPLLADALAKGFAAPDLVEAFDAMLQSSTGARPDAPPWAQRDWSQLDQLSYLPFDATAATPPGAQRSPFAPVLQTLALGLGDDAVARVARTVGRDDIVRASSARAASYWQLFDGGQRLMRPRDAAGQWLSVEPSATAWLATTWPALHDPAGFRAMLGGSDRVAPWLNELLQLSTLEPGDALGPRAMVNRLVNDPMAEHIPWLYAYSDEPWRGQALVRRLARQLALRSPARTPALDAWLVFATLGFYPAVPASGDYVLGAPLVRSARVMRPGGKPLLIVADGASDEAWAASDARLDGQPVPATALRHTELMRAGELRFNMQRPW